MLSVNCQSSKKLISLLIFSSDFLFSSRAQNRASGAGGQQGGRRQKVTNQVIRKGWLQLGGGGFMKGSKDYWFVLTGTTNIDFLFYFTFLIVELLSTVINGILTFGVLTYSEM